MGYIVSDSIREESKRIIDPYQAPSRRLMPYTDMIDKFTLRFSDIKMGVMISHGLVWCNFAAYGIRPWRKAYE